MSLTSRVLEIAIVFIHLIGNTIMVWELWPDIVHSSHWYKNATVSAKMTTKDLTSVSYNGKILCAIYACMHNFAFIIVWPFCHLLRHLSPLRPCTCRNPEGPQSCKVLQLGPFRGFGWDIFGVFHLQCRLIIYFFWGTLTWPSNHVWSCHLRNPAYVPCTHN